MSKFFLVPVKSIKKLTSDSVNVEFDLSSFDSDIFTFKSGQYITIEHQINNKDCLLYTSPSPRDRTRSRMPSSA